MHSSEFYLVLFAVFLPTLIHVFIFTGAFILVGALKGKSVSGYFSIFIFLLCAVSFLFYSGNLDISFPIMQNLLIMNHFFFELYRF